MKLKKPRGFVRAASAVEASDPLAAALANLRAQAQTGDTAAAEALEKIASELEPYTVDPNASPDDPPKARHRPATDEEYRELHRRLTCTAVRSGVAVDPIVELARMRRGE